MLAVEAFRVRVMLPFSLAGSLRQVRLSEESMNTRSIAFAMIGVFLAAGCTDMDEPAVRGPKPDRRPPLSAENEKILQL